MIILHKFHLAGMSNVKVHYIISISTLHTDSKWFCGVECECYKSSGCCWRVLAHNPSVDLEFQQPRFSCIKSEIKKLEHLSSDVKSLSFLPKLFIYKCMNFETK